MDDLPIRMMVFYCYVRLPEGIIRHILGYSLYVLDTSEYNWLTGELSNNYWQNQNIYMYYTNMGVYDDTLLG